MSQISFCLYNSEIHKSRECSSLIFLSLGQELPHSGGCQRERVEGKGRKGNWKLHLKKKKKCVVHRWSYELIQDCNEYRLSITISGHFFSHKFQMCQEVTSLCDTIETLGQGRQINSEERNPTEQPLMNSSLVTSPSLILFSPKPTLWAFEIKTFHEKKM